jgi:lysozyme family protein
MFEFSLNLKREYGTLFSSCSPKVTFEKKAAAIIQKTINNREELELLVLTTKIPWYILGLLKYSSNDPTKTTDRYLIKNLQICTNWYMEYILYTVENLFGWNYRLNKSPSPYLWMGANFFNVVNSNDDNICLDIGFAVIYKLFIFGKFLNDIPKNKEELVEVKSYEIKLHDKSENKFFKFSSIAADFRRIYQETVNLYDSSRYEIIHIKKV